jgi:hypothetical protein
VNLFILAKLGNDLDFPDGVLVELIELVRLNPVLAVMSSIHDVHLKPPEVLLEQRIRISFVDNSMSET